MWGKYGYVEWLWTFFLLILDDATNSIYHLCKFLKLLCCFWCMLKIQIQTRTSDIGICTKQVHNKSGEKNDGYDIVDLLSFCTTLLERFVFCSEFTLLYSHEINGLPDLTEKYYGINWPSYLCTTQYLQPIFNIIFHLATSYWVQYSICQPLALE